MAITLLDWQEFGRDYAAMMGAPAQNLARDLIGLGLPVYLREQGGTTSHQFAIEAAPFGGGQTASKPLRKANLLACGIGLPIARVPGDLNGLRLGTPEIVRWGMKPEDMPQLASFIKRVLVDNEEPEKVGLEVTHFRSRFRNLHYVRT